MDTNHDGKTSNSIVLAHSVMQVETADGMCLFLAPYTFGVYLATILELPASHAFKVRKASSLALYANIMVEKQTLIVVSALLL